MGLGKVVILLIVGYFVYRLFKSNPKLQDQLQDVVSNNIPSIVGGGSRSSEALNDHNACIRLGFSTIGNPQLFWESLSKVINDCVTSSPLQLLQPGQYANNEETRRHIKSETGTQEVVAVIGVGKDIKSELALKEDSVEPPVFFGADPVFEENDELFSRVGTFFPFAVGATTGMQNVKTFRQGTYREEEVVQIDLVTYISQFIRRTLIDDLWIDAEGQEYEMLPMFYKGGALDVAGVVVCQVNLEIHNPDDQKKQEVREFIERIVQDNRYGLAHATRSNDLRLYFVNFADENCLEKFVRQFYKE